MNEAICPNCGMQVKIDEVIKGQIETNIISDINEKHKLEMDKLKLQIDEDFKRKLQEILELEKEKQNSHLELEKQKIEAEFEMKFNKSKQDKDLLIQKLEQDSIYATENNKKLVQQLEELNVILREERNEKAKIKLEADRKLLEEENKIREESKKIVDEEYRFKILELEKKLNDTSKSLQEAQRKSEQSSGQLQGEVLELELESLLQNEFVFDEIVEVKKGIKGADIVQTIKNNRLENCGIILYESKNANWQLSWLTKFKADIRESNANIGILVSKEMPLEYGDMKCIDGVWVVKPKLVIPLAIAIRNHIISVYTANNNSKNKDEKMEVLYQFLIGPEFKHRIESIIENYTMLQNEIEKEKRAAQLRWSKQEKWIRNVIDNTLGIYGDLQGITNGSLSELKQIDLKEDITV